MGQTLNHRLFLLFNHTLTPDQVTDAETSLEVGNIVPLPETLQALWGRVPADVESIAPFLDPFKEWLAGAAHRGDYVLIQGDSGACYLMVRFAMGNGLIPIYATTRRQAREEALPDGSIRLVHHFIHRRFRRYGV